MSARRSRLEEQAIRRVERQLIESIVKGDSESARHSLTDEFVYTGPDGATGDKTQFLQSIRADMSAKVKVVSPEESSVKVYGNTSVSTGSLSVSGEGFEKRLRYTAALVKRGVRWQLVALQLTPMAEFAPE
jgi:hypothetical protein